MVVSKLVLGEIWFAADSALIYFVTALLGTLQMKKTFYVYLHFYTLNTLAL